jgi:hypothetical protein
MIQKTIYPVDRYHTGIRLAVLIALFLGIAVGAFQIMPVMVTALGLTQIPPLCINGFGGLLIGTGSGWLAEKVLLSLWPSGRKIMVDDAQIELNSSNGEPVRIDWARRINVLSWRFVVPRARTLVPKGWYCLACRLTQDDKVITFYTFASPDESKTIKQWDAFEHLISQKDATGPGSEHLSAIVAEQGQLRSAERDRWQWGAEMSRAHFFELAATVDSHVENWPD